jgi:hypothetical protein
VSVTERDESVSPTRSYAAAAMGAENEAVEAPPYSAQAVDVVRLPDGREERDPVAFEEPLEIRIGAGQ